MNRRTNKKGIVERFVNGICKLLALSVGCLVVSFVVLTGSINMNVSFNKDQLKSITLLERISSGFKIVKNGCSIVDRVIK